MWFEHMMVEILTKLIQLWLFSVLCSQFEQSRHLFWEGKAISTAFLKTYERGNERGVAAVFAPNKTKDKTVLMHGRRTAVKPSRSLTWNFQARKVPHDGTHWAAFDGLKNGTKLYDRRLSGRLAMSRRSPHGNNARETEMARSRFIAWEYIHDKAKHLQLRHPAKTWLRILAV